MRSVWVTFLSGYVEWKNVENWDPLTPNERWMLTDVSERINAFPTHTLEHIPLDEPAKFQLAASRAEADLHKKSLHPGWMERFFEVD